jgi:uncharacterized tellurite resistance protein B-like protein
MPLQFLRDLFAASAAPRRHDPHELHLAAGALLIEAAELDGHFDARERTAIAAVLRGKFSLTDEEVADLMQAAGQRVGQSTQLFEFTRVIGRHFAEPERIELFEMLFEVMYADGVLHDFEAGMLRQLGQLLYVTDRDRGAARKRVLARLSST